MHIVTRRLRKQKDEGSTWFVNNSLRPQQEVVNNADGHTHPCSRPRAYTSSTWNCQTASIWYISSRLETMQTPSLRRTAPIITTRMSTLLQVPVDKILSEFGFFIRWDRIRPIWIDCRLSEFSYPPVQTRTSFIKQFYVMYRKTVSPSRNIDWSSKLDNNVIPDPWLKRNVIRSRRTRNWIEGYIINREWRLGWVVMLYGWS